MEGEISESKRKNYSAYFYVLMIEIITISIVLISLFIIKSFFGGTYKQVYKWYSKTFLTETDVRDVIEETQGDNYEI